MSYTFSVSHQNITKKVSCTANTSINRLVELSIEKLKLPGSTNACLSHKGKKLDGMISIRLTNLLNNAKLELLKVEQVDSVNLRINGTYLDKTFGKIVRVNPSISVTALVSKYLQECGETASWNDYYVEISALQNRINNLTSNFDDILVASLVGGAENASLRLSIEDPTEKMNKQKAQLEESESRKALERQRYETELALKEKNANSANSANFANTVNATTISDYISDSNLLETASSSLGGNSKILDDILDNSIKKDLLSDLLGSPKEILAHIELLPVTKVSSEEEPVISSDSSWQPPKETEDTLYTPRSHINYYENPEDDYNVTTHHAETYLKSLQAMQKPKRKIIASVPSRYTIRIRFPDRQLLDILMEDSSVPLGKLFKKLDGYVHPKFRNSYILKNGSPPFEKIQMGFSRNNIALKDHPQFQQEKLLLVWEPAAKLVPGPYLNQELQAKDLSEMPTVALESNRQNLVDDPVANKTVMAHKIEKAKPEKRNGVPKWFRP